MFSSSIHKFESINKYDVLHSEMNERSDLDDCDVSDLASITRNKISQRRPNANESNRPSLYPERDDII